jgi:hypothetical protein
MSIAHLAPGGTKFPHIPLGPWRHKFPQYHLFRIRTGKYSIPYNPFRWASLQKGHPDK